VINYTLQLLLNHGVEIPTTGFANSPLDTDLIKWLEVPDRKITRRNTRKRVVLVETKKAAESVINAFKSLNANILVRIYQRSQ
jgi:ribosomal protein S6--L-glutamate ligase